MLDALRNHYVNAVLVPAFEAAGYSLFVVGGPVRDALSGSSGFSDLDYTTNALPIDALGVITPLGPTWTAGLEYGTVCVQIEDMKVEITTHRTEAYDENSRKPTVVFGNTIEDDLKRRDLTINAMAMCLVTDGRHVPGEVIDLFGGQKALTSGVLTTPDAPLRIIDEDPLRALRAIRFAVRRSMVLSDDLASAITSLAYRLEIVAVERRTEELRKILAAGPEVTAKAFVLANELGVAEYLFGAFGYMSTIKVAAALGQLPPTSSPDVILGTLATLHRTVHSTENVLRNMKLSTDEVRFALGVAQVVTKMGSSSSALAARRLVRSTDPEVLTAGIQAAVAVGELSPQVRQVAWEVPESSVLRGPLPVTGDDFLALGLQGKAVGTALRQATDAFLVNPSLTRDEALQAGQQ